MPPSDYPLFQFSAKIISGAGIGKELGFPTANLDIAAANFEPGVYAVRLTVDRQTYWGLLHCGARPTFDLPPSVEVWIEDFEDTIREEAVAVTALARIRGVKKFNGREELQAAIAADVTKLQEIKSEWADGHTR